MARNSLRTIFLSALLCFCKPVPFVRGTTTSQQGNIIFTLAPQNVNGTSHASTCRHYGMQPTEKLVPIKWDEQMLLRIAQGFSFESYGKLGCCEQTAFCDWAKKTCFSTGFGRSSGYYNGGWKRQVTSTLAHRNHMFHVSPIYTCVNDIVPVSYKPSQIYGTKILSSSRLEVLGKDFGKNVADIEIFLGDRQCESIKTCHTVCSACGSDSDCANDEECLRISSTGPGMCLKPCQYNMYGDTEACECNTECRRLFTGVQYKRFCMNKGIRRISEICQGQLDSRLKGEIDSKVICKLKQTQAQCTDAKTLTSSVSVSKRGFLSSSINNADKISLLQCDSDADCDDNDPCTIDTCSTQIQSNGITLQCCNNIPGTRCEASPVELGEQQQYSVSKDYFVSVEHNRTLVENENRFAKIAKIYIEYPVVAGFVRLSVSDVDDSPVAKVGLPFSFAFFDSLHDQIWINPNGAIQFDGVNQCGRTFMSYDCSFQNAYNNLIAAFVTDLNPKAYSDAAIYFRNDTAHVDILYKGIPFFQQRPIPGSSPRFTFLTRLHADGTIQIYYGNSIVPVQHKPSLIGLRDDQRGSTTHDILLRGGTTRGTVHKNTLVTYCPSPNFACTETKCGKPGSLFKIKMLETLKCANEGWSTSSTLRCRFGEHYSPASYSAINHEISCVVPSHFASGYSALTNNPTNYSKDVFTVNVAIVVGNDNIELPLYSVHTHLAKLRRKPLMFTIDNRPDFNGTKRLACQQITPPQCGACLVEDDAAAGKDCMGKCFGYAMRDSCALCTGGTSGIKFDASLDCANVCQGKAKLDACKLCSGGTTKREPITDIDKCTVVCENGLELDDCGICGGNNALKDCDGVCFGTNTKCFKPPKSNSDEKGDMYEEDGKSNANVMLIFTGAFTISFGLIVYYTIKYRRMVRNGVMDRANNRENGLLGRGVTNEELNAMYVWEYTGGGQDNSEDSNLKFGNKTCSICISDYCEGESLRRLHCDHCFHTECIDMWFQENRCCPICKQDVAGRENESRRSVDVEVEMTSLNDVNNDTR